MKLVVLYVTMIALFSSCSLIRNYELKKHLVKAAKKDSVLMTLDHLEKRLPKGERFFAGVGAPLFENGSKFKVETHEVKYWGTELDKKRGREVHVVRARVLFTQKNARDQVNIKYTYELAPRSKRKVNMLFVYGFPERSYLSREDPLAKFRKTRWLPFIKKRKLRKGMPVTALKLSWGEPTSFNSTISILGANEVYGYGGYKVVVKNGKVVRWQRSKTKR